jgi:hypothetical protein
MAVRNDAAILLLVLVVTAGCRGATPEPVARAEEEKTKSAAAAAQPATPPAGAEAPPKSSPARDDAPVVVDPGGGDGRPVSLAEAARAEKERRAHAGEPVAVINDKTLPKYAAKGQITIAAPKEKKAAAGAPAAGATATEPVRDEPYWRGRALDIRERWHQAADDVKELEQRSAELRQKFYLESDDFTRDNQIKPEWDRVLDKLRQARLDVETTQKELAAFLEEGRAAGALPGWLREGEDEEPETPKKKDEKSPAEAIDAPILEPPPSRGVRR